MGRFDVEVDGREFRYYDDGGVVMVDGEIVGTIDERELDLFRDVDPGSEDIERRRSDNVLAGRIRAMALGYLRGRG